MKNMLRNAVPIKQTRSAGWVGVLLAFALLLVSQSASAQPAEQRYFANPEAGVNALVDAVRLHDVAKMNDILGPDGEQLINSGDEVADRRSRNAFIKLYKERHQLVPDSEEQMTLVIGNNEWPMPIPLVKSAKGWYFDVQKGDDEILARQIGRNESTALKVLLEIVDSEREYAALNRTDDSMPEYAARIISSSGKRDGLYWPTTGNEPLSPIGELVAAAAAEGYAETDALQFAPYHGYLFRILTRQGKDAVGGEQDYVVDGRMTRGFAAIAWPARHGVSGAMTFMVNQDGQVFEKNLGTKTAEIVTDITSFNPDAGWKPIQPRGE